VKATGVEVAEVVDGTGDAAGELLQPEATTPPAISTTTVAIHARFTPTR